MEKRPRIVGGWEVHNSVGKGGNAEVFRVTRNGQTGAMKMLKTQHCEPKRLARFRDEIEALRRCSDIPGVLPVFDFDLLDRTDMKKRPWVVMGLLTPA